MAYRETEKVRARKETIKLRLFKAAEELISEAGFKGASVAAIAARAGVATGTVYRYFPDKSALCAEVFRHVTQREVDQVAASLNTPGGIDDRLRLAIATFARRALRGRRLAYALIAEPVDPVLDQERLNYRQAYAELFSQTIAEGVNSAALRPQNPKVSGAALVGALAESLIGPLAEQIKSYVPGLSSDMQPPITADHPIIIDIAEFCINAVGPIPKR
ncbi:Transcriptional regulator [Hahella chejuensis KCTC 2396]|uniref:Transcriptional regulator n=1 Tax=Hahella chejuensis (strain KCTC 2396) TaxID=349521 RepID=Q2SN90_HAHCH|nr:TetR/AcrR family transcriptional regulator [Hahella chejuensis]ABC27884.1 Transcriptional regulator [Hahella chejuensis KCTC 2396]